jgi:predicted O-methyltransferase YrrM
MSEHPSQTLWTTVDRFLTEKLLQPDPMLDAVRAANAAANLPAIDVAPNQGKFLHLLARMTGARRILELGTLGGYSAIWLARALPPGGRLITLEFAPHHAEVARSNIARAGLSDVVEIRVGPAVQTLAHMVAEHTEPFDFIFIDADKPGYPHYLDFAVQLSRPGTVILADNVIRDGDIVSSSSNDPIVQGTRRFLELLAAHPRLSATALQTVGSKGYDGFAMALVLG